MEILAFLKKNLFFSIHNSYWNEYKTWIKKILIYNAMQSLTRSTRGNWKFVKIDIVFFPFGLSNWYTKYIHIYIYIHDIHIFLVYNIDIIYVINCYLFMWSYAREDTRSSSEHVIRRNHNSGRAFVKRS